jgi:phosphoribosylglycinamide formyltransferase 1
VFRIGVLVSSGGTNLQAILDAVANETLAVEVALVVSNRSKAYAVERARQAGVPVAVVPMKPYPTRAAHEAAVGEALRAAEVDLVVLAGYDRVVSGALLDEFAGRIINIHPSLLPAFGNTLHAQEQAFEHGVKVSGCTVHFVTAEVDAGPIIVQRPVPVLEDDTVETLRARILGQEHRALPEAIGLIAAGRVRVEGRRARILPAL